MIYAHIKSGVVHNIIVAEADFIAEHPDKTQFVPLADGFGIGDLYDGVSFGKIVPPEEAKSPVNTVRERLKAIDKGKLNSFADLKPYLADIIDLLTK